MAGKNFLGRYWKSSLGNAQDHSHYVTLNTPVKPRKQNRRSSEPALPAPKALGFNCADSTPHKPSEDTPKPKQSVLKLNNFVRGENSNNANNLEVLERRMLDHNCQAILFVDCVEAADLQRWSYAKTRLCRQLGPLLLQHQWTDQGFQTTVVLRLEDGAADTITNDVMAQIQKDPEIVGLQFRGTMERSQDLRQVVFGLVGLLSLQDRKWKRITFEKEAFAVEEGVLNTDTAIRKRCQRILKAASTKFKVPIDLE
jgi:hypothetical protein